MRPLWLLGLGLALAVGGFVGGMEFQKWRTAPAVVTPSAAVPAADGGTGSDTATLVVVTERPAYVRASIGGRVRAGRAPLVIAGIRPGRHELTVSRKGYPTFRAIVDLAAGERREQLATFPEDLGLAYRPSLAFPDLRVEVYDDAVDGEVVGVFGRIENRGKLTVRRVQIRLRFLDAQGKLAWEEFVHPVLVSGSTADAPLAPGTARDFAVKAPAVPVALCCERVDWAVTLIDAR